MVVIQQTSSPLRILCFGAGAIGTYIGGSLVLAGHKVVFLETPDTILGLLDRGLRLEIDSQTFIIEKPILVPSIDDAIETGPFDIAIFALKSFDTASALDSIKPHLDSFPTLLCLQNGVANEPLLASVLGPYGVIAGTVTSAVGRKAAGDIVLERLRGVGIAAGNPLSRRLVNVFSEAGLNGRLYSSAPSMKWSKLLTNLPANASSAILDMTPAEIFSNANLFRFELLQLREALEVIRAQNLGVVNLPGTPAKLFAFAIRYLPPMISQRILTQAIGGGRGGKMPSFHIDLYQGRGKSEVVYLNGAVADVGDQYNIPTPANHFLTDTLIALVKGNIPLNAYAHNPEKFMSDFNQQSSIELNN